MAAAKLALLCWVLLTACQVVTPSSPPITRPVIPQLRDPAPLPRVAYLWAGPRPGSTRSLFDVFRDELPSYGWVDGQNVIVDSVSIDHQIERYPSAIAEIIASRPAVIVVGESVAAPMVKEATTEIPVVLTLGGNFVAAGQACSVNRPCGNITGLSLAFEPLSPKRAEMLKEMAPATQRLGFLRNGGIPETELELDALQRAAPALGLEIVPLQFRTPADFPSAFREATDHAIDGLVVMPDSLSVMHRAELLRFTSEHGLPDAYGVREHAVDGGLLAYGADRYYNFRRAAFYVDRILRGTKPSDLPIEQPTRFELVINLARAHQLGLTIPRPILLQATEAVQ